MMEWLAVFVGGGLGSLARFGLGKSLGATVAGFPLATLLANIAACLVLGFFAGYAANKGQFPPALKLGITAGFCGGFSTFSTFSLESMSLMGNGKIALAAVYVVLSVSFCFVGVWAGQVLGRQ